VASLTTLEQERTHIDRAETPRERRTRRALEAARLAGQFRNFPEAHLRRRIAGTRSRRD